MNDLMLLAMLLDGPKHGYAIKKEAGLIAGRGAVHNNLIYPPLRRFVAQHWVTQRQAAGDRGQRRHVYSLTPRGRRVLLTGISTFDESDVRSPDAFRMRVGLFGVLSPSVRKLILGKRKAFLQHRSEALARLERGVDVGRYGREVVSFLRRQTAAELDWINHLAMLEPNRYRTNTHKRRLAS